MILGGGIYVYFLLLCLKSRNNFNVYVLFEEYESKTGLTTTEEYIRRIQAFNLPKQLEKNLIELGIEAREWADSQNSGITRFTDPITISLFALMVVVEACFVYYWYLPQVQEAYRELAYILVDHIGEKGTMIAEYTYLQVAKWNCF